MRYRMMERLWKIMITVRLTRFVPRLRCDGNAPARCWVSVDGYEGYYRDGILRQYCVLFRNHHDQLCVAPITTLGVNVFSCFSPDNDDDDN